MKALLHTLCALDCAPIDTRESLEEPELEYAPPSICTICSEPEEECICCQYCRKYGEVCEDCAEDRPREGESNDDFFSRIYGIPLQGPL
jgi:hypothetical protein